MRIIHYLHYHCFERAVKQQVDITKEIPVIRSIYAQLLSNNSYNTFYRQTIEDFSCLRIKTE